MSETAASPAVANPPPVTKKGGATRKALLDSTIELLASTGYAATTTQAVLNHAGISRGSLLHQFKTRDHLMVAAALEAVERMICDVKAGLENVADPIAALHQYPDVLWLVQNEPPARAYAELQLASRWEQGLRGALGPAVKQVNERIVQEFCSAAAASGLRDVNQLIVEVGALISAMQGLAVSSTLMGDPQGVQAILGTLKAHFRAHVERSLPT